MSIWLEKEWVAIAEMEKDSFSLVQVMEEAAFLKMFRLYTKLQVSTIDNYGTDSVKN